MIIILSTNLLTNCYSFILHFIGSNVFFIYANAMMQMCSNSQFWLNLLIAFEQIAHKTGTMLRRYTTTNLRIEVCYG